MRDSEHQRTITPREAIARARWTVKLPSMVSMFVPAAAFLVLIVRGYIENVAIGAGGLVGSFVIGFVASWLVWSVQIPRWRLWAYQHVDDITLLKEQAVAAQLIWPEGHVFERTEIASKQLREEIRVVQRRREQDRASA